MFGEPRGALGKYRLIAEIARGGMGIVYLAIVQGPGGFNKLVVIKELKPDLVEEPAYLQMFLDEAKLAARLNHPNIVQTNEVGNDAERYFMAMDYLDGRGLDRVHRRARSAGWGLSTPMHLRITCDILAGLEYAHKLADFDGTPLHIVHRDVSPQNVFITFDGQVKLLDFGIAKTADASQETRVGVLKGKVSYMAPEQARGAKVDARADVYAAGVVLWESLAGRKLRKVTDEASVIAVMPDSDTPRLLAVKPTLPAELDEITTKALAADPAKRYQSAGEMRDAIEAYLQSSGKNVSARDVGLCISELFKEDRASVNALIEQHMTRARSENAAVAELPIIEMSYESHGSLDTPLPSRTSSSSIPSVSTVSGVGQVEPKSQGSVVEPASAPKPMPDAPKKSSRGLVFGGLAVAAVAIVGGGYAATRGDSPKSPAVASTVPTAPLVPTAPAPAPGSTIADVPSAPPIADRVPSPPPAPVAPTTVDVNIHVSPANALVTIDDVSLPANPFHRKYMSDPAQHKVRATAPGYLPKVETVTFDANVTLDLSLERQPVASRGGWTRQAQPVQPAVELRPVLPPPTTPAIVAPVQPVQQPVAQPQPNNAINPQGGIKPRRPIDQTNPYGTAGGK
jgi:serine/threonine-protein kinase